MRKRAKYKSNILVIFSRLLLCTVIAGCLTGFTTVSTATSTWTNQQMTAHEIAELARSLGLSEDNPIIVEAQRLWFEDYGREQEISILTRVIYNEAGNGCCEEHQLSVGKVVMNRVDDPRFPSTVYDVVAAPRQYRLEYATGGRYDVPAERRAEFESLARRVLAGEPYDFPVDVVYQDNQKHGTGVYKSFYSEYLNSTTYFCYG